MFLQVGESTLFPECGVHVFTDSAYNWLKLFQNAGPRSCRNSSR